MIAAISAIALLLIMFIFKWFGLDLGGGFSVSANAWQSFGFIDIILFITILVAVGLAVMKANQQSVNLPVAASALTAGLGILSLLLVLFRIISPPDFGAGGISVAGEDIADTSRKIGVFLGFIATAGIAYGGYLAMQEEGTSFQSQADRLQNRGDGPGGAPPPPPPPAPPAPPRDPGSTPPPAV